MARWIHLLTHAASMISLYIVRPRRAQMEALLDGLRHADPGFSG